MITKDCFEDRFFDMVERYENLKEMHKDVCRRKKIISKELIILQSENKDLRKSVKALLGETEERKLIKFLRYKRKIISDIDKRKSFGADLKDRMDGDKAELIAYRTGLLSVPVVQRKMKELDSKKSKLVSMIKQCEGYRAMLSASVKDVQDAIEDTKELHDSIEEVVYAHPEQALAR